MDDLKLVSIEYQEPIFDYHSKISFRKREDHLLKQIEHWKNLYESITSNFTVFCTNKDSNGKKCNFGYHAPNETSYCPKCGGKNEAVV